jgi:Arylsulfotransferase (ASST)
MRRRLAIAAALAALLGTGALAAAAPSGGPPVTCTPAKVGASASLPGLPSPLTVSPAPGTRDASPHTQLSLLGPPPAALGDLSVVGSATGPHHGSLEPYASGDGASFIPDRPFAEGETVAVTGSVSGAPFHWSFQVAVEDSFPPVTVPASRLPAAPVHNFVSRPDLRPPVVSVTRRSSATAPGLLFMAPYVVPQRVGRQSGPMIFDNAGRLIWFDVLPPRTLSTGLAVQQYQGQPVLTWWQNPSDARGFHIGEDVIYDSSYHHIATVHAGNGYQPDLHEFQLTPQNSALIAVSNAVRCDLRSVGGHKHGAVWNGVLQEIDIPTGLVKFEWTALDHVALSESHADAAAAKLDQPFDFFHLNSISLEADGSLLISARSTWAAYDIDRSSGQILWRLGGKDSDFKMGFGTSTAWQHDARALAGGQVSIFDNGAVPRVNRQSRGIVLGVDVARNRVVLLHRFEHRPSLVSPSQGDMQQLVNGDWLVGWGQDPYVSEFDAAGRMIYDAHLPAGYQSYRALRFAWNATPARPPVLVALRAGRDGAHAYASWNGATGVSAWRAYAGASPSSLIAVGTTPSGGFETRIRIASTVRVGYVQVAALDAAGSELARSPVVAVRAG